MDINLKYKEPKIKYRHLIYAPEGYYDLSKEEKKKICNGVGPKGYGWLFPNSICLLNVKEAADIHDYMYFIGKSLNDKREADNIFLENLILIIEDNPAPELIKAKRLLIADLIFKAVDELGESAFFDKG